MKNIQNFNIKPINMNNILKHIKYAKQVFIRNYKIKFYTI